MGVVAGRWLVGGVAVTEPYFDDGQVALYVGDVREVLPALGLTADLIVTDCPYGETSLKWDRWVDGWPALAAQHSRSMWCFGSMRMFGEHWGEFTAAKWRMSQDVIWEKNAGTGIHVDRFRRVHETALHWYTGRWSEIYKQPQRVERPIIQGHMRNVGEQVQGADGRPRGAHLGTVHLQTAWRETGTRLMTSVIRAKNLRGLAIHPTEKPVDLLRPLIEYACPPGGLVLDLFAGSSAVLDAARQTGRRAIGIEANEAYAEKAARRLSQTALDFGAAP